MRRRRFLQSLSSALLGSACLYALPASGREAARTTGYAYPKAHLGHSLGAAHPESPRRLAAVERRLSSSGLSQRLTRLEPATHIGAQLYEVHTREHVRSIRDGYPASHQAAAQAVGCVLSATRAVCEGRVGNAFCATRPPGHHALNTGREEGFCFYNSVAIGARYAQREYGLEKVLIVDWDYHHGNGTEDVFYSDPSVLFFSTHDFHAYPGTGDPRRTGSGAGAGYNINVHLDCGANDDDIVAAFERQLLPAAHAFAPDIVFVSAGFDSRKGDPLGCFEIGDAGFVRLTEMVMALAREHSQGRLVSVLEGGYNLLGLASAVEAHVRTLMEEG